MQENALFSAFAGPRRFAAGPLPEVLAQAKARLDSGERAPILLFDDRTGRSVDFDLQGSPAQVLAKLRAHPRYGDSAPKTPEAAGPGRPRLGVLSREVSLLPRQWNWLESRPNGISATLRRLVDAARHAEEPQAKAEAARDATGAFMWAMAGDLPGFEEASRALYAGDRKRLERLMKPWPQDIREQVLRLSAAAPAPTLRKASRSPR